MALINHAKKEINAKIVYYGPAGSGKKTALNYIYSRIKPTLRGELRTVPAGLDNLLLFDFSPFDSPLPGGYRLRLHVYTLTGPVTNPATWKMTLKGADGIVIMVNPDVAATDENKISVNQLRDFLAAYGVGLHETPAVLQLNHVVPGYCADDARLAAAALELDYLSSCNSMATSGEGLLEALSALSRLVIERAVPTDRQEQQTTGDEDTTVEKISSVTAADEAVTHPDLSLSSRESAGKPIVRLLSSECTMEGTTLKIPLEIICNNTGSRVVLSVSVDY